MFFPDQRQRHHAKPDDPAPLFAKEPQEVLGGNPLADARYNRAAESQDALPHDTPKMPPPLATGGGTNPTTAGGWLRPIPPATH